MKYRGEINASSIHVDNNVIITGSLLSTSITSSLLGSASYALTASYALNGGSGGTIDTSSFVKNIQTSSMTVLSSSYALTASYALNGGGGSSILTGIPWAAFSASFTNSSWGLASPYYTQSFNHNLNTSYIIVSMWDSSSGNYEQVNPDIIRQTDLNNTQIFVSEIPDGRFDGRIVISTGAGLITTSSYAISSSYAMSSISSSYSLNGLSSSYAATASYALNGGGGGSVYVVPFTVITSGSWNLVTASYESTYSNAYITPTSVVDVIPYNSSTPTAIDARIYPMILCYNGYAKLSSIYQPLNDISASITIMGGIAI